MDLFLLKKIKFSLFYAEVDFYMLFISTQSLTVHFNVI